jgi:hypothetical protein
MRKQVGVVCQTRKNSTRYGEGRVAVNLDQLGMTLRGMYDSAPQGVKTTSIHFFGVKYASEIRDGGFTPREVVHTSGINASYVTELSKGMRLSNYVIPRPEYSD